MERLVSLPPPEPMKFTVTQLAAACADPAYRAALRATPALPPPRAFAPPGQAVQNGAAFHAVAAAFLDWLAAGPNHRRPGPDPEELWKALYKQAGKRELDRLLHARDVEGAARLNTAFRAFTARLADLLLRNPKPNGWAGLFVTHEHRLADTPLPVAGGGTAAVAGRVDALRATGGGFEIVDYKLSRGASLDTDLTQLAIYCRLFRASTHQLRASGVLEYYEPQLHVVPATHEELERVFATRVQPVLDELAAPTAAGDADRPPAPPRGPHTPAAGAPASPGDPAATARAIEECFAAFKLPVRVESWHEAPQLVRYRVQPEPSVKAVSLANRVDDLRVKLGCPERPAVEAAPGCVHVDVPKPRPDPVAWEDFHGRAASVAGERPLSFAVGLGATGEPLVVSLADPNTCHALVAGATGSGKSEFLRAMAASLMAGHKPGALRISLVDPKRLTFTALEGSPYVPGGILTAASEAIALLADAVEEMNRRYELLASEGHDNLAARIAAGRVSLPFHVLLFDEFADLVLGARDERREFERLVAMLAGKGRAAGIHLVLATQRPDRTVVTGLIKANLPLKVCLRVTGAVNSQLVLDRSGAENLLGKGDLLCDRGRGVERAQAPLVSAETMARLARG